MPGRSKISTGTNRTRPPAFKATCFDDADSWERWLKEYYPPYTDEAKALRRLVGAGCDRERLIDCLMHLGVSNCEKLSKLQVRKAISTLDEAAEWVRRIDMSDAMVATADVDSESLIDLLFDYEEALTVALRKRSAGDGRVWNLRNDLIATIVRLVRRTTGRWYDQQVSTLINVALPSRLVVEGGRRASKRTASAGRTKIPVRYKRLEYTLDIHMHWRKRHQDLLSRETASERAWKKASSA